MARLGIFDDTLNNKQWFDDTNLVAGWFDEDLVPVPAGGGTAWTLNLSDSVTLSDATAKAVVSNKSDTVTLSEAIAKATGLFKADTTTLSEAIAKAFGGIKADSVTLSEALAKAAGIAKADNITLSEAIAKATGLGKDDAVTLSEIIAKATGLAKDDSVTLSDVATPTLTPGGGPTNWVLNLADTVVLSDIIVLPNGTLSRNDSDIGGREEGYKHGGSANGNGNYEDSDEAVILGVIQAFMSCQ